VKTESNGRAGEVMEGTTG